jgi:excisionase family DNA binding protein
LVPDELLSVEQVAERLGLHVRTVRNYVRDGRLKAVRIGKQYRIARADLDALTGGVSTAAPREDAGRYRRVEVSTIVQVDAISTEDAGRVATLLNASAAGRGSTDQALRIQTIYDEERASMKVIVIGGLAESAETLRLIGAIVGSEL